jgi:N-methylhydantoinase A/oxoprolinase/acetone carboxylase beta subunit
VLDPDEYLGGELKLDVARAKQALLTEIGEPLGIDAQAAALITIEAFEKAAGDNLAGAIRNGGREPGATCLVAYGGGGPMIVTGIAAAAGIKRIVIPRLASVFSAFGIGFSHLAHAYQVALDGTDPKTVAGELRDRAERDMYGEGVAPDECRYESGLWGAKGGGVVEAPLADAASFAADVDDARVTLKAVFELPTSKLIADDGKRGPEADASGTAAVSLSGGTAGELPTYDDTTLLAGQTIEGPGLIRGAYLTCLIRPGWSLRVTSNLDLIVEAN